MPPPRGGGSGRKRSPSLTQRSYRRTVSRWTRRGHRSTSRDQGRGKASTCWSSSRPRRYPTMRARHGRMASGTPHRRTASHQEQGCYSGVASLGVAWRSIPETGVPPHVCVRRLCAGHSALHGPARPEPDESPSLWDPQERTSGVMSSSSNSSGVQMTGTATHMSWFVSVSPVGCGLPHQGQTLAASLSCHARRCRLPEPDGVPAMAPGDTVGTLAAIAAFDAQTVIPAKGPVDLLINGRQFPTTS